MSECLRCKYYDSTVDCCNADEHCFQVGFKQGEQAMLKRITSAIRKHQQECDAIGIDATLGWAIAMLEGLEDDM